MEGGVEGSKIIFPIQIVSFIKQFCENKVI